MQQHPPRCEPEGSRLFQDYAYLPRSLSPHPACVVQQHHCVGEEHRMHAQQPTCPGVPEEAVLGAKDIAQRKAWLHDDRCNSHMDFTCVCVYLFRLRMWKDPSNLKDWPPFTELTMLSDPFSIPLSPQRVARV